MFRTEREVNHSFVTTGFANYSYKTVTIQGEQNIVHPTPVVNNIVINNNNNIGNSKADSIHRDAVSTSNNGETGESDEKGAKSAGTAEARFKTPDGYNRGDFKPLTRLKKNTWRNITITLVIGIVLFIVAALLWNSDIYGPNPIPPDGDGVPQTMVPKIELSSTETSLPNNNTTTPKQNLPQTKTKIDSIKPLHIEINYMLDLLSISNRTKEVVIKSTNETDADSTLSELPSLMGQMAVTVVNNGEQGSLRHLREVLEWISLSIFTLTIDGNISSDQCNSSSPPISPSFLQRDILNLPNLVELKIHNLNYCFISLWIRHFRLPGMRRVRVFSVDDTDQPYHQDLVGIFNKSHFNYTIDICGDEIVCSMY